MLGNSKKKCALCTFRLNMMCLSFSFLTSSQTTTSGFPWIPLLLDPYPHVLEDTLRPTTQTPSVSSFTEAWGRVIATASCTSSVLWPGSGSLSLWVCCKWLRCCSSCHLIKYSSGGMGKACLWFVFVVLPPFRQKEMFQIWHIILQRFIRENFLSSVEFSRAIPLGKNPAVMLCTSSTQSLNSGTSQLWRGKDLFLGLGQFAVNLLSSKYCFLYLFNINLMLMFVWNRHSATLMSQKLVIFGGRKTATYLNDLHVLDLGKMMMRWLDYEINCPYLSWYSFFLNEGRIHGVHSCEVWEHATAASRVSSAGLINLERCH